ncbi:MAG: hypothetical protein WCQ47_02330 [bacterium]
MDFLITNAKLVDPLSKKIFPGGVAVVGTRIVEIYNEEPSIPVNHFDRVIDAKGKYLLPGFFDVHSKSDLYSLADPSRINALSQGILVEVIGQDAFSVAPVSSKNCLLHTELSAPSLGNPQLNWRWESVFQYLDHLHLKTASNMLFYSPHGTMRLECSLNPKLSSTGLSALAYIFEKSMDDGAIGLSISSHLEPSNIGWDDDKELSMLLNILKKKEGVLCVNIERSKKILKDVDKAITLARTYGLRLHISRILPNSVSHVDSMLSIIDKRKKETQGVIVDISPYTSRLLKLADLLPKSMRNESSEEIRIKFKKSENVKTLLSGLDYNEHELEALKLVTSSKKDMKKYEGVSLENISMEKDETVYDTILGLLTTDFDKVFVEHPVIDSEHLRKIFEYSFVIPATTGYREGRYLPDMFSTIPTYFNNYSKGDVSNLISKLSSTPAEFYKIKWGIKKGLKANFILLDTDSFIGESTYTDPRKLSEGIDLAVVNGKIALEKNKPTGSRTGEVLSWV